MQGDFQKRHYEQIAQVLRETRPENDGEVGLYMDNMRQWETTAHAMIKLFVQDNPKFDMDRFIKAIKLQVTNK